MLANIKSNQDLKKLSQKELELLATEIRKTILEVVGKNGGHLASNLGVVELTIALHRIFDLSQDAIVWDVSHQCYAHKLLTGRFNQFSTLRKKDGISGFTNYLESPCDFFTTGHASTSISSALGLLTAWELEKKTGKVVAVIGDGALTGGMAFEALSNTGQLKKNLIVVLNDNQMSIDHNTGSLSRYLSRLSMSTNYQTFKKYMDLGFSKIPFIGPFLIKVIYSIKRSVKGMFFTNNLFTDFGFEYIGPLDGHNEKSLEKVFKKVKKLNHPVVVHIVTKKGKGYSPAENAPELFHGIGPFQISDGTVEKYDTLSFTEAFSKIIVEKATINSKLVCVTAAMAKGTGLTSFSNKFANRFFDVGIAEEHAVTFAGGLSKGGLIPVVCIYSTFLQRSIDQIIHDVTLQEAHVIFMLDRAGPVSDDGITHQGIFDISLLKPIPNLYIMAPVSQKDLELCFEWAINQKNSIAIRYPKLSCPSELKEFASPIEKGKGILIKANEFVVENIPENQLENIKDKVLVVCTGGMFSEVQTAVRSIILQDGYADIYILRFIKPLDEQYFINLCKNYKGVVFVEDGIITGSISSELQALLLKNNYVNTKILAFEEKYYAHASRAQILDEAKLSSEHIKNAINEIVTNGKNRI